jgi:hypothetical protein
VLVSSAMHIYRVIIVKTSPRKKAYPKRNHAFIMHVVCLLEASAENWKLN